MERRDYCTPLNGGDNSKHVKIPTRDMIDFPTYVELNEKKKKEKIRVLDFNSHKWQEIDLQHLLLLLGKSLKDSAIKHIIFIDIERPTPTSLSEIGHLFELHPLTVEDCFNSTETTEKNEIFDNYRFIVITEVSIVPDSNQLQQVNVNLIVSTNFVICTHQGPVRCIDQMLNRMWKSQEETKISTDWIMYATLDTIVDTFFSFVQQISLEIDSLDDLLLILSANEQTDFLRRIGMARKRIAFLRTHLVKKKGVISSLINRSNLAVAEDTLRNNNNDREEVTQKDFTTVSRNTKIYLRDVFDHIQTMLDDVEAAREALSNINSTYLARVDIEIAHSSNHMGRVMKIFAAMTTIILPLTFITGLWGMNVEVPGQPNGGEPRWFYLILGGMGLFVLTVIILFKKFKWF